MGRRIVAQMLTCMDDLANEPPSVAPAGSDGDDTAPPPSAPLKGHVFVIGAHIVPHSLAAVWGSRNLAGDGSTARFGGWSCEVVSSVTGTE